MEWAVEDEVPLLWPCDQFVPSLWAVPVEVDWLVVSEEEVPDECAVPQLVESALLTPVP